MRLLEIGMRSSSGGVWEVVEVMKEGQHTDVCNPEIGHLKFLYLKYGSQIKLSEDHHLDDGPSAFYHGMNEVLIACSRQSNPPCSCCKDRVQPQMPP
jgi:hypothetical protein